MAEEGNVVWRGHIDEVICRVGAWREAGATHVSVSTMDAGLSTVDDHLAALALVSGALGLG